MVERHLAKVNVASSNLVFRSKNTKETRPKRCVTFVIRRHGQAVRQRSATPISPVRFRVAPPEIVDNIDAIYIVPFLCGF